jgi:hypothetical protein
MRGIVWGTLAGVIVATTGCSTMNNTERGVLTGGAIGAGLGTAIGSLAGDAGTGAVVGGLLGGGLGGIAGNDKDQAEARQAENRQAAREYEYAAAQPNRIWEVVDLTKQGHDPQTIINHIRKNQMRFDLSVADLNTLKSNGVSSQVINEMQTGSPVVSVAPPRTVVVREEVPVVVPAYPDFGPHWYHPPRPVVIAPRPVVIAPRPALSVTYQKRW